MQICRLSIALLISTIDVGFSLLRGRPDEAAATQTLKASRSAATATLAEQALAATGSLGKAVAKSLVAKVAQAQPSNTQALAAPTQTHQKVDVGFSQFEKNLTDRLDATVKQASTGARWTKSMQAELSKNMTDTLKESIKSSLQPLKLNIAKTWMALPQDSQKDEYVVQLRSSFMSIFADALENAGKHLSRSLEHIDSLSKTTDEMASADLLSKAEQDIADRFLVDHCYEMNDKKTKKPSGSADHKLCMKSVVHALTHRLNDTLGLISMTMRFDSGAMSLAQKKGGSLLQNSTSQSSSKIPGMCAQGGICEVVWDGKAPHGKDGKNVCEWKKMAPGWYLDGGKAPDLCLRSYPDAVSDHFKAQGFWHSCMDLAAAWNKLPDTSKAGQFADRLDCGGQCSSENGTKPGIYVDVGANIGTCVTQMLARQDVAQVVAFEPSPANLFYMTSSITKMIQGDARVAKNLLLYPNALGSERSMHTLSEQPGNAGNTGVNTTVMGAPMKGVQVETITLDQVFMSGSKPPYIHLMKVDAQGYEVKILQGGKRLLASGAVNAMHIEVAPWWLAAQKTSSVEYLSLLHVSMFDLRPTNSPTFLSTAELTKLACDLDKNGKMVDMFALRNRVQGSLARPPLRCSAGVRV